MVLVTRTLVKSILLKRIWPRKFSADHFAGQFYSKLEVVSLAVRSDCIKNTFVTIFNLVHRRRVKDVFFMCDSVNQFLRVIAAEDDRGTAIQTSISPMQR